MKKNLEISLNFTLEHEGLYSSVRSDGGNWTGGRVGKGDLIGSKYGISAPMLEEVKGEKIKAFAMKLLSKEEAKEIAHKKFWNVMFCYELPSGVDLMVFDHGFNAGTHESVGILQKIVGAKHDGIIGIKTMTALENLKVEDLKRFLPAQMIVRIQKELKLPANGEFNEALIRKIKEKDLKHSVLCLALANEQEKSYRSKAGFRVNGNGWLNRLKNRVSLALQLLKEERNAPAG